MKHDRLISAVALEAKLKETDIALAIDKGKMYKLIDEAPTVDAVEVVRCKDCVCFQEQYHTTGETTGKVYCGGYCYHWDYEQGMSPNHVDGDDFCSYGERRTNG